MDIVLQLPKRDPNPQVAGKGRPLTLVIREPLKGSLFIYTYIYNININVLAIVHFRILINFNIFLVVGPLGGVPPPKPPCFFPGAAAPGPPRPSHSIYERFSNSKTVLFGRVVTLKLV